MPKLKIFVIIFSIILLCFVLYFYVFSKTHYKISTSFKKDLFVISGTVKKTDLHGICDAPDCGNVFLNDNEPREDITLSLTEDHVTSLLNQYLPAAILLRNIKVHFVDDTITGSATSFYPVLPGYISATGRLYIKHFYVNDVYIGSVKAPSKVSNFIEANGDKIMKDTFYSYKVYVSDMFIENNKLILELNTPKGMFKVLQDGTIKVNL